MKLADRIATYEKQYTTQYLLPRIPIVARIDFRGFSKFSKSLKKGKAYDERLSQLMIDTAKYVCDKNNALVGYTQSDELNFIFKYDDLETMFFGGRVFKYQSLFAAQASGFFNKKLSEYIPEKADVIVECDCRVFNVPNDIEAYNALMLREEDCTKNAINMAAACYYSPSQLMHKNGGQQQEMLFQKGVNFNDFPDSFKRGTYVQKQKIEYTYTEEQLAKLKYKPEGNVYYRCKMVSLDLPPIRQIQQEMIKIIFGEDEKVLA